MQRAAGALEANGITALRTADAGEAKRVVLDLIPDGSQVHHGASESLDATGITHEIETVGRYDDIRSRSFGMEPAYLGEASGYSDA